MAAKLWEMALRGRGRYYLTIATAQARNRVWGQGRRQAAIADPEGGGNSLGGSQGRRRGAVAADRERERGAVALPVERLRVQGHALQLPGAAPLHERLGVRRGDAVRAQNTSPH